MESPRLICFSNIFVISRAAICSLLLVTMKRKKKCKERNGRSSLESISPHLTRLRKVESPNMYLFPPFPPRGIFRSHSPRFEEARHYSRNISRSAIRLHSRRNSEIIVSAYRSIPIKYLPRGSREETKAGRRRYEGRRRRSSASLGLYLDAEGREIEKEGNECGDEGEGAGTRGRRIETENSISLPREPQARR